MACLLPSSRLESKRQNAGTDRHRADERAVRKTLVQHEAACGGDEKRRAAAHQRIDQADISRPIGRRDQLKIGKLQQGRCRR